MGGWMSGWMDGWMDEWMSRKEITEKKKIYVGDTEQSRKRSEILSPSSLEVPRVIQNHRVTSFEIFRTYVHHGFAEAVNRLKR